MKRNLVTNVKKMVRWTIAAICWATSIIAFLLAIPVYFFENDTGVNIEVLIALSYLISIPQMFTFVFTLNVSPETKINFTGLISSIAIQLITIAACIISADVRVVHLTGVIWSFAIPYAFVSLEYNPGVECSGGVVDDEWEAEREERC